MIPVLKMTRDKLLDNKLAAAGFVAFPVGWMVVYGLVDNSGGLWPFFGYACLYVAICMVALAYYVGQLGDMLLTDPVTNVYNKRYFFKALDTEFSRSKRGEAPLALVTFSLVNVPWLADKLGRSAEYVHRVFCETVAATIRNTDVFSRVDANTYTLLLSNTDDAGAQALARRLDNLVMREFRKDNPVLPDVVAFGICCTKFDGCKAPIDIYDNSARAHSRAMESERNRIMSCHDDGMCSTH